MDGCSSWAYRLCDGPSQRSALTAAKTTQQKVMSVCTG
jgi:hypothetical protein